MRGRKMKYNRMLCWVRPHEKKELKEAVNGQFPLVFAKNFDDFKNQIRNDDYLVISLTKARRGLLRLQELIRCFPNNNFVMYQVRDDEVFSHSEFLIMNESNVVDGQYDATEIRDNFLGIIKDLWTEKRENVIPIVVV